MLSKSKSKSKIIIEAIACAYIDSASQYGFNGVTASSLSRFEPDEVKLRVLIAKNIRLDKITAVFSCRDVNIHIKRLPSLPIEEQLDLLKVEPMNSFALYPNESEIHRRVDLSTWSDRPFSQALLLSEAQLSFRAFDMAALERYVADPRYKVNFNDYMGTMSVTDDYFLDSQYPDRDKVSLQAFGLGFDQDRVPYVVVYLRYLSNLSSEHQQYWKSFLATCDVRMSEPYYQSSIKGEFWKNRSVRYAILEEMRLIQEITNAIWGETIFRKIAKGDVPIGLTSFLRPTAENFNRFVMALDKLLSESIEKKFFDGKIPLELKKPRPDGKLIVEAKGTLTLLEEWLLKEITWDDPEEVKKVVIGPLREVRRLRQKPAHAVQKDEYSLDYRKKRRKLMWDVLNSLSNIRATLAKHTFAQRVCIPEWLDSDQIDVF